MANNNRIIYIGGLFFILMQCSGTNKNATIAYVDTPRLLQGFTEAIKANHAIDSASGIFDANVKSLQDSATALVNKMSVEYNGADIKLKTEMEKKLAEWNDKLSKYRRAGMDDLMQLRQKKMKELENKVNQFVAAYGQKHGYDLILGTTAYGNILYGSKRKGFDITDEVVGGLNEKFK